MTDNFFTTFIKIHTRVPILSGNEEPYIVNGQKYYVIFLQVIE